MVGDNVKGCIYHNVGCNNQFCHNRDEEEFEGCPILRERTFNTPFVCAVMWRNPDERPKDGSKVLAMWCNSGNIEIGHFTYRSESNEFRFPYIDHALKSAVIAWDYAPVFKVVDFVNHKEYVARWY